MISQSANSQSINSQSVNSQSVNSQSFNSQSVNNSQYACESAAVNQSVNRSTGPSVHRSTSQLPDSQSINQSIVSQSINQSIQDRETDWGVRQKNEEEDHMQGGARRGRSIIIHPSICVCVFTVHGSPNVFMHSVRLSTPIDMANYSTGSMGIDRIGHIHTNTLSASVGMPKFALSLWVPYALPGPIHTHACSRDI